MARVVLDFVHGVQLPGPIFVTTEPRAEATHPEPLTGESSSCDPTIYLALHTWENTVKYFFLSDGWSIGRIWELGGPWDFTSWQRSPHIRKLSLGMVEKQEHFWLYEVEEAVLMLEVQPSLEAANLAPHIGQVTLKRLMTAEQILEHLAQAEAVFQDTPRGDRPGIIPKSDTKSDQ